MKFATRYYPKIWWQWVILVESDVRPWFLNAAFFIFQIEPRSTGTNHLRQSNILQFGVPALLCVCMLWSRSCLDLNTIWLVTYSILEDLLFDLETMTFNFNVYHLLQKFLAVCLHLYCFQYILIASDFGFRQSRLKHFAEDNPAFELLSSSKHFFLSRHFFLQMLFESKF